MRKKFYHVAGNFALTLLIIMLLSPVVEAQKVAVKSNLLYDAVLCPTIGVEAGVAPQWSVEISGTLNAWDVNDRRWKMLVVQPEARYWFCQRFSGHFAGVHLIGGQYNWGNLKNNIKFLGTDFSKLSDRRYQGWMAGAGVAYGYSWILNRHWNVEAEVGVGWIYTRSDEFNCKNCGKKLRSNIPHNYVGPTKAAINIVYVF